MNKNTRGNRRKNNGFHYTDVNEILNNNKTLLVKDYFRDVYNNIKKDGKQDKLLAAVEYASVNGYTVNQLHGVLVKLFTGYINKKKFTVDTLYKMIDSYSELSDAWYYGAEGQEVTNYMLRVKARNIALHGGEIEDIKKIEIYNKMYKTTDNEKSENSGSININYNWD